MVKTLHLRTGRNNHGAEIAYTDHIKEVLTLNDKQLVTKYTWDENEKYTFVFTYCYCR